MYSGITQGLFEVTHVDKKPGLITYSIKLNPELTNGLKISASIAIDGVCQTVVSIQDHSITLNAMQETLAKTTLSDLYVGRKVSVERSLRVGDENGGHEVAGHVIGTATITDVKPFENNLNIIIRCDKEWLKYILPKGFIAVDGSSLTVGEVDSSGTFAIHLIPETLRLTNFGNKKIGDKVNIELDHRTRTIVDTVERVLGNREK